MDSSNILLFDMQNYQGLQFIPLRTGAVDFKGASFQNVADKWALNDALRFEIKGAFNSEVRFKVRYC